MRNIFITITALLLLSGCRKERMPAGQWVADEQVVTIEKVKIERPVNLSFISTPDKTLPGVQCLPSEYGIMLSGGAFIRGIISPLGPVDPDESWVRVKVCNMGAGLSSFTTMNNGQLSLLTREVILFRTEEVTSLITGAMGGQLTISGGTGRFTGATGSISIKGRVNLSNGTLSWTGSGMIAY